MRLCGNAMARAEFKTGAEVMEFFSLGTKYCAMATRSFCNPESLAADHCINYEHRKM